MNSSFAHDVSFHDHDSAWPAGSLSRTGLDRAQAGAEGASPEGSEVRGAGRGRPSTCTTEQVQLICSFIRLTGLSDTAAAAMAGVKRSTLARWKKEDEEVEMMLDQARFQYQAPRLAKIDEKQMKDGQPDWRAQAWLVKFANPEMHGAPSRRRRLRDVELEPTETPEEKKASAEAAARAEMEEAFKDWESLNQSNTAYFQAGKVISPAMLALMQQRRAIAIREMNAEKPAAAEAEPAAESAGAMDGQTEPNPAAGAAAPAPASPGEPRASSASWAAGATKNVTIRPEIPGLTLSTSETDSRNSPPDQSTALPANLETSRSLSSSETDSRNDRN